MNTKTLLLVGGLGVVGYLIYRSMKGGGARRSVFDGPTAYTQPGASGQRFRDTKTGVLYENTSVGPAIISTGQSPATFKYANRPWSMFDN